MGIVGNLWCQNFPLYATDQQCLVQIQAAETASRGIALGVAKTKVFRTIPPSSERGLFVP